MSNTENSKTATTTAVATKRVVTIVTTKGEKRKVEFNGTSWSELKSILERGGKDVNGESFRGYDLNNMKCVESARRNTLEHPTAVVPEENFNLFLMPVKSKSGASAMSRTEAYSQIKSFIAGDEEKAKAHFNGGGKNYTVKSTDALIELIESYKPGTKKAVAKEKAGAISDVVESVKSAKEAGNNDDILSQLAGLSTDEKLDVVIQLLLGIKSDAPAATVAEKIVESEKEEVVKEKVKEESAEEKAARLQREADQKETEELMGGMNELMGGFSDVRR